MAEPLVQLIAGLGNPGPQYAATRHNAGFWLVDELARSHGGVFRADSKCNGETCRIDAAGRSLWLLKPMTFMNRSGQAIVRLAGFYKITPPEILVVHDELDLLPGAVRLKRGGGHGGHNGLRDIVQALGGNDFRRLRLGIGHPGNSREVLNYVLGNPPLTERRLIEDAINDTLRELPRILAGDYDKAMQALHSRPAAPTL